jgi:hypothetical protein
MISEFIAMVTANSAVWLPQRVSNDRESGRLGVRISQSPIAKKAATNIRQKNADSFADNDDHQLKGLTPAYFFRRS